MSFDSSRFTFNPWNDFLGVVMQQGRVQLDSDWNEWLAEFARRMQADSLDTMGRAVVPATTPNGFKIKAFVDSKGQQHLTIGAGRMYVDGLLVENHGPADSALWDPALAELSGAPAAPPPAAEIDLEYTTQPYLLGPTSAAPALPAGPGPFLAYLDVWRRPITYLEHPELIDPAVGVDTTGRLQTVWQVKLLPVEAGATCEGSIAKWDSLIQPSGAQLTTNVVPSPSSGPCCLNAATGYTGLENQLYRVEIHQGGDANASAAASPIGAAFKWSRDNASVITGVTAIGPANNAALNPTTLLSVESTGRDNVRSFQPGDWIEITDDFLELSGQAGELHQIDSGGVDKALNTIRLQTPLISSDFQIRLAASGYHTRITRWNQGGKVLDQNGNLWIDLNANGSTGAIPVPEPGTTLVLENGVTVAFSLNSALGNFKVADFWSFAARAADGTVEILNQAPPRGIHHHYTRLSIVTYPTTASDCRTPWPPPATAGADCACTVCVDARTHNSGVATIDMAVQQIKAAGGGRICLGPGIFNLRTSQQLNGLTSVEFSGQGPATAILFTGEGAAIAADSNLDLTISDLSIFAVAQTPPAVAAVSTAPVALGISVRNSVGTTIERCAIFAVAAQSATAPSPAGAAATQAARAKFTARTPAALSDFVAVAAPPRFATMAIGLQGFLFETVIRDNALFAEYGIGQASLLETGDLKRSIMALAGLDILHNLLICSVAGVSFSQSRAERDSLWNVFALEIAIRSNHAIGCTLLGIAIAGEAMLGSAIRIAGNYLNVTGVAIGCGADNVEIADNFITSANAPAWIGIFVESPPATTLPSAQARILRNRISNYAGLGINVSGLVLLAAIVDNSIMQAVGAGIVVTGPAIPAEAMVRNNQIFNIGPPTGTSAAVNGVQISGVSTVALENNSIALIGNSSSGTAGATAINVAEVTNAIVAGNDISDVGPLTAGGNGISAGVKVSGKAIGIVNMSNNVIRQTTGGSTQQMPFNGIAIAPDAKPSSLTGYSGQALVNGNMVFGNDAFLINVAAGNCVVTGNLCQLALGLPGGAIAAAVAVAGGTCIASNNRIISPGQITGLSIEVPGVTEKTANATVLGNIVTTSILLNHAALPEPWKPLNVIA